MAGVAQVRLTRSAGVPAALARAAGDLDEILRHRTLGTVFQPIVHLESGCLCGYEALVRPPPHSGFRSAGDLLETAYRTGRVVELDWLARASACRAAVAGGLASNRLLFMNIEPLALDTACPADLWPDIERAFNAYRVVLEVTERSLDRDPSTLINGIQRQRPTVKGLAIDDVGANPATVALLPLLSPTVIKLDLQVIQSSPADIVQVLDVAYGEAERTAAVMLAEGIETAEQLRLARAAGAELGQGHYLGKPADLPQDHGHGAAVRLPPDVTPRVSTPFDALWAHRTSRAPMDLLTALSTQIQMGHGDLSPPSLLLCHFPDPLLFGAAERERLAHIAARGVFTVVFGPGIPADPGPGIRGIARRHADLAQQWAVVTLGPSVAAALLAQAANDDQTEFDFAVTHHRERVIAAALNLYRRLSAEQGPP